MYFDTSILCSWRTILFQRLLPKLGSQAHFNTTCFLFAVKMAADTNELRSYMSFYVQGMKIQPKG